MIYYFYDFWYGYVEQINNDGIICILKKEHYENIELKITHDTLTKEQLTILNIGLVIRFDIRSNKIDFMTEDQKWI